jgi:hypothetical protein
MYYTTDFSKIDWGQLPSDDTVVFFDDHQDAPPRLHQARKWGFRHLLFEDNYPIGAGDCVSLKKVLESSEGIEARRPQFERKESSLWSSLRSQLTSKVGSVLGRAGLRAPTAPSYDASAVRSLLATYEELPPVLAPLSTRWGTAWDHYRSPAPLFRDTDAVPGIFDGSQQDYTWMCYVKVKPLL